MPSSAAKPGRGILNSFNARRMLLAVAGVVALAGAAQAADISGAGATFPYPVYSKWADAYRQKTGIGLNYQSIGSGGGIKQIDRKSTRLNSSHEWISYAVFCLKKKKHSNRASAESEYRCCEQ